MPLAEFAGAQVEVDEEGFMLSHDAWNRDIGLQIAREEDIEMTDRHWEVVDYMRSEFDKHGTAPSIRKMKKEGVVPVKELYALFPGGPAKKAAKIAGLPKPKGCI